MHQLFDESDVAADLVQVVLLLSRLEVKLVDMVRLQVLLADDSWQTMAAWVVRCGGVGRRVGWDDRGWGGTTRSGV